MSEGSAKVFFSPKLFWALLDERSSSFASPCPDTVVLISHSETISLGNVICDFILSVEILILFPKTEKKLTISPYFLFQFTIKNGIIVYENKKKQSRFYRIWIDGKLGPTLYEVFYLCLHISQHIK